ncbi:unnamed protein product [Adineta steineri]|uniref:Uncharacterized protein n=1 Tax=Adineta steineri TaxID=433720 RepID=A0A819C2J3_9BILA|nr:unnamed protein product [Adineta steineri]
MNELSSSFNQPKFCPTADWNPFGITFSNQTTLGEYPYPIFINTNNTVYTVNRDEDEILMWINNSINPNKIISVDFFNSKSVFITNNGDIYYDNGNLNHRVDKWISSTDTFVNVMNVNASCYGLFIDINDTLYCSVFRHNKVFKRWLNESEMIPTTAAGSGIPGSASNELSGPWGIFVDLNFDLYVADWGNDRIQLFKQGELNGKTIVGQGSLNNNISLDHPSGIVLDADKYLFIVDKNNHRIIRSGPNDIRCIIGCSGEGSESHQLRSPSTLSFDSYGNIFIVDKENHRIQKFDFLLNSCDNSSIVQSIYSSVLTEKHSTYSRTGCDLSNHYYEAIQMHVNDSRYYTLNSDSSIDTYGYMYTDSFYPTGRFTNLIMKDDESFGEHQFEMRTFLRSTTANILVITTYDPNVTGSFSIIVSGINNITFERLNTSSGIQSMYSSELTADNPKYSRDCDKYNYHYETIEIDVITAGFYIIASKSSVDTLGYIYNDSLDPFNPSVNKILDNFMGCDAAGFQLTLNLVVNVKYILVVTTLYVDVTGSFSIIVSGPANTSIKRMINPDKCVIGSSCDVQTKGIGITLDDILRYEINRNMTLKNQSLLVTMSVGLTIVMFLLGFINSILSLLTFQNANSRKVGCGIYLLASSVTSLTTISMFTINFWFALLTQINSSINLSVRWGGCISIEPLLKFFLYFDTWLNACVAIERAIHVYQGVHFNKEKSKRFARWIIFILPFCIIATIIHEPLHRNIFEHQAKDEMDKTKIIEIHRWCVIRYSHAVQNYNTAILFVHLIGPFIANLFSALFIIFGTARQRSLAQTSQNYIAHIREQLREHKQLVISPAILLILAMPRLIISLLSGCVKVSDKPWLYLCAYFISFTPSILVFIVFVVPSELYRKTLKESLRIWQRRIRH